MLPCGYPAALVSKLNDAEGEPAETQTWIEVAARCEYLDRNAAKEIYLEYDEILAMVVSMANNPQKWTPLRP